MKIQNREIILDYPIRNEVMGKIAGYHVRPGLFDINGAMVLESAVPSRGGRAICRASISGGIQNR